MRPLQSLSMRVQIALTVVVGLSLTVIICLLAMRSQDQRIRTFFERDIDKVSVDINTRLKAHFDMLLAIRGLYASSESVERDEFSHFIGVLDLTRRYPGFQAIQFVRAVPEASLGPFVARVRRDVSLSPVGFPDYQVHPVAANDMHYVIEFCEPAQGNEAAFGLDLAAFPVHKLALEIGRDSGQIIATEPIRLVQEIGHQVGFVARAPIYRNKMPVATVEQRRAALTGFASIVFRTDDLMDQVIDRLLLSQLDIRILDSGYFNAAHAPAKLLYESAHANSTLEPHGALIPGLASRTELSIGGRRWNLEFAAREGTRYRRNSSIILLIGTGGLVISLLSTALLVAFRRRRTLAEKLHFALEEQRAFQDNAMVGIILISENVIKRSNRGMEEMMGFGPGSINGLSIRDFIRTELECDSLDIIVREGMEKVERWESEWPLVRKDGSTVWCMIHGKSIEAKNWRRGAVWVIHDISDRKRTEAALVEANLSLEHSLGEVEQQKTRAEAAHDDLAQVLAKLKQAQSNLVISEKMASLGSLVAGIAHELNTPIGNSLLAATALSDRVAEFEKITANASVKRSSLTAHLADTRRACSLLAGSLHKAAHLIASFKQVAVDQTIDERRVFDLRNVLFDTLATYAVQLRRGNCVATLDAPIALSLDSYPGSIGQVINNLINNTLLHAMEGRDSGSIHLSAQAMDDDWIEIIFRDDGVGMTPEVLHRVFDPFFTTKMGQGGSGLGMNIVYNIITAILGGRITVEASPGQGSTVRIAIPRIAPLPERNEKPGLF